MTFLNGEVVGRHAVGGSSRWYYRKDHLGSVQAVVDATGAVKEARDNYPFIPLRSISCLRLVWAADARAPSRRGHEGSGRLHRARAQCQG